MAPRQCAPLGFLVLSSCLSCLAFLLVQNYVGNVSFDGVKQKVLKLNSSEPHISLADRLTIKELIPLDSLSFLRLPWNEAYGHELIIYSVAPVKIPVDTGNWILRFQIFLEFPEKQERCCQPHVSMSNRTWEMDLRLSLEALHPKSGKDSAQISPQWLASSGQEAKPAWSRVPCTFTYAADYLRAEYLECPLPTDASAFLDCMREDDLLGAALEIVSNSIVPSSSLHFTLVLDKGPLREKQRFLSACMGPIRGREYFNPKAWIEHIEFYHRVHGVEHFFIYARKDVPDELFKQLYPGLVTFRRWFSSATDETIDNFWGFYDQYQMYNHCLQTNKHTSKWLTFFDLDDFLIPQIQDCKLQKSLPQILTELEHCATYFAPVYPFLLAEDAPSDLVLGRCTTKTHKGPQFLKTIIQPRMARKMFVHEVKDFEPGYRIDERIKPYCHAEEGVQVAHCRMTPPSRHYYTDDSFNVTLGRSGLDCFEPKFRALVEEKTKLFKDNNPD